MLKGRFYFENLVEAPEGCTPGPQRCEGQLRYRLGPFVLIRTVSVLGRTPVPGSVRLRLSLFCVTSERVAQQHPDLMAPVVLHSGYGARGRV